MWFLFWPCKPSFTLIHLSTHEIQEDISDSEIQKEGFCIIYFALQARLLFGELVEVCIPLNMREALFGKLDHWVLDRENFDK